MKPVRLAALFLLLALGVPQAVRARETGQDRVRTALQRTDARLEQARSQLGGRGREVARHDLEEARDLQDRARGAFAAERPWQAIRLTLLARARAERAIARVRGLPEAGRVQSQLDRTRDLLERSRPRIDECGQDRARATLQAALAIQLRAEAAASEGRTLAALQLTQGARQRALDALRACDSNQPKHPRRAHRGGRHRGT